MFSLYNLYNKNQLTLHIEHNNKSVELNYNSIINKRNKEELVEDKQFVLLEAYLDYKGDEFKNKLIDLYVVAEENLMLTITRSDIYPLPVNIVHSILDVMDYQDILYFIKDVYKIEPLSKLVDVFDDQIESDGLGTREQTYTKSEYLELVALSVVIKSVLGLIGQFGYLKSSEITGVHKEYILYNFIATHSIANIPAIHKLAGFINKLVEISLKEKEVSSIRVIEKRIPREETSLYILSIIMLQKVAIATVIDDTNTKNIITRIFNYTNNKLSVKGDVSNTIRNKQNMLDADTNDGEKESILEAYRVLSVIPKGLEIELNWSIYNIDVIISQLHIEIDYDILNSAILFTKPFLDGTISKEQVNILGFIFKDVIDPRGLAYVKIESITNLLAVGFAYLWKLDCKYMALLLTSIPFVDDDESMSINITVNRNRITNEIKEILNKLYPYERVINADTTANLVEETIANLSNEIYAKRWSPTATDNYIVDVMGDVNSFKVLQSDIKLKLAEMIIKLENVRRV